MAAPMKAVPGIRYLLFSARAAVVNVRGLMCQGPEKVRGMAIKDITSEMDECFEAGSPQRLGQFYCHQTLQRGKSQRQSRLVLSGT